MSDYSRRYPGTRWRLCFGRYDGVERFAVDELQQVMQAFLPYTLEVHAAAAGNDGNGHVVVVGTADTNPQIRDLLTRGQMIPPDRPQGFTLASQPHPDRPGCKRVVIAGFDPCGVLYGVQEFNARVQANMEISDEPADRRKFLDEIPAFSLTDHPRIENRGIWTWGYVIYDYRRFLDHMARLRLNMLTIWNDCPPVNCREVIAYAHDRGIKVILGFHWGWGVADLDPTSPAARQTVKAEVLRKYRTEYAPLGMDGIYFQTFTERNTTEINGQSVAALVCDWVNDIATELYKEAPNLYVQFGLHAASILDRYPALAALDQRLTIVWEDAGVIPYWYSPTPAYPSDMLHAQAAGLGSVDATLAYSKKLVAFRANREFGMVPKGWTCLRWNTEFENHGPFILGHRTPEFISRRFQERKIRWQQVNAQWLLNYPLALRFYREILACQPATMTVTGLVEDGCFEEAIPLSVALFAETLWNPLAEPAAVLHAALRPRAGTVPFC